MGQERRTETVTAGVLLLLLILAGTWQVASVWSRRGFEPFSVTPRLFEGFSPSATGWTWHAEVPRSDPVEPNLLVFRVRVSRWGEPDAKPPTVVPGGFMARLVHGYNMVDCMRIKGYTVELLEDTRATLDPAPGSGVNGVRTNEPVHQLWRLTSEVGDVSIWASSMLSAGQLTPTGLDTRDVPFPRIGTPDDPRWVPTGLSWRSFRHPVSNLVVTVRHLWNNARCDLLTFLRVRQPAWASDEVLTLVTASSPVSRADEGLARGEVLALHRAFYVDLRAWAGRWGPNGVEDP